MMNKFTRLNSQLLLLLLLLGLLLSGCGTSQKTDFYQLEERSELSLMDIEKGAVVGVGPINLPEYINRPQIVTRISKNHLNVSEFNRWIEPVNDSVRRLLVINLSNNLNSNRIYGIPGYDRIQPLDLRIGIDVGRFDGQLGKEVLLESRWSLYDKDDKPILIKVSLISMPVNGNNYPALVLAMNNALQALGEEISQAAAEYLAK
jgi:uncharacterized lipoprotein YmbA